MFLRHIRCKFLIDLWFAPLWFERTSLVHVSTWYIISKSSMQLERAGCCIGPRPTAIAIKLFDTKSLLDRNESELDPASEPSSSSADYEEFEYAKTFGILNSFKSDEAIFAI